MPVVNGMDVRAGVNGSALFNGTESLPIIQWEFNPNVKDVDFENSKSGGFDVSAATFKRGNGTIVFDYDFIASPFGAPLNLFPGTILANVKLLVDKTIASSGWMVYQALITSVPTRVTVGDRIGMSFQFKTTGAYAISS